MFWWMLWGVLFQQMFLFGWAIPLTVDVNVFKEWFSEAALSPSFPQESRCQVGAWQWYLKDWSHSLKGRSLESWGAGHHYRIKYFCEWDCSATYVCRKLHVPLNLHHFLCYHASNLASSGSSPSWNTRNHLKRTFPPTCQKHTQM